MPGRTEPVTLVNAGFVPDHDAPSLQRGIPGLGADTEDVLRDLAYSAEEISRLRERGAI